MLFPFKYFAVAIITTVCFFLQILPVHAQNVKTYIPPQAMSLTPIFKSELQLHFPEIPAPWYTMALAEHESCQYLTHPRCMQPTSSFTTKWPDGSKREQGAGLAMLTRAWMPGTGALRMDTLSGLKKTFPQELKDLTWENINQKPELQIRAMVLLLKSDYAGLKEVTGPMNRLYMADSAYNGGRRDVNSARRICGLTTGCNPQIWFGHVELHCVKSKKALYSGRSACDINTHHVQDVVRNRMPKYQPVLPTLQ